RASWRPFFLPSSRRLSFSLPSYVFLKWIDIPRKDPSYYKPGKIDLVFLRAAMRWGSRSPFVIRQGPAKSKKREATPGDLRGPALWGEAFRTRCGGAADRLSSSDRVRQSRKSAKRRQVTFEVPGFLGE